MIPQRVTLENFLSFGSPAVEIAFTDDEPLWVLGGPNGVGKSAIFDAITFCLYGQHRGGKQDNEQLVRHGANGFQVTYEFELDGKTYRIMRARQGKSTQRVEQLIGAEWKSIPNITTAADVLNWSERTLGLGFEAFSSSVLLRQGEADAMITARGAEKLKTLKKVIEAEKYEALSNRVHDATRTKRARLDALRAQRDGLTLVTEAEVEAAREAAETLAIVRETAQAAVADAMETVNFAKQWSVLEPRRSTLQKQIEGAAAREAEAALIRERKQRFDDLAQAVPILKQLVEIRGRLADFEWTRSKRQATVDAISAALKAKQLREEIGRTTKHLEACREVAELANQVGQFDQNLATNLLAAQARVTEHSGAETKAGQVRAAAEGLLRQSKANLQKITSLDVGVNCSLCGQEVTAEHAQRELDRLNEEIQNLEAQVSTAHTDEQKARLALQDAKQESTRLDSLLREQGRLTDRLADRRRALADQGAITDADELTAVLEQQNAEAATAEAAAGDCLKSTVPILKKQLAEEQQTLSSHLQSHSQAEGKRHALLSQLSSPWQTQWDALDARGIRDLEGEQQTLRAANVDEQFEQLQQDDIRREEWKSQLEGVLIQIDAIPVRARLVIADAEQGQKLARRAAEDADRAWQKAKEEHAERKRKADDFRKLLDDINEAENVHDVHAHLDALLGKAGLQRELVRTAEQEIVRYANDTVRNLSDGDLTLELQGTDGTDEAFALRVRRANDPTPIGVDFLSGSQKFRVAVAVALAIGRFAAGHGRRLESVIIDEGFGSLDRDGLKAAADELNRLRSELRRIVLVSHQDEFANSFPVVIRLTPGENGTTAAPFRR